MLRVHRPLTTACQGLVSGMIGFLDGVAKWMEERVLEGQ